MMTMQSSSCVIAALLVAASLGCSAPTAAADRALIMTISNYPQNPLPGASLDDANFRQILTRMGIGTDRIRSLKDKALTAQGIRAALEQLVVDTQNGDRVFVHFSGHGTSQAVGDSCQQSLVGHDLELVPSGTLAEALQRLRDKASKVMVVVDACHSGGIVETAGTRGGPSAQTSQRKLRPRYLATRLSCDKPVNVLEQAVVKEAGATRSGPMTKNYLFLAAARHDEVAFDEEGRGGMATTSLLDCLRTSIPDTDRSGGVSLRELVQCAQAKIDANFVNDPQLLPQHLTLAGNADLPLAPPAQTTIPASTKADPVATLTDLQHGADGRWQVDISATPAEARIGQDAFALTVTSNQRGYLYLIYVGSDRKEFLQLFPSPQEANLIEANQPFRIPGEFAAQGPAGTNHLLALVAASPRDFGKVLGSGSAAATLANAAAIQDISCANRNLKRRDCLPGEAAATGNSRNLKRIAPADGQADSYGAARIELIER
ncbi:caspase family protein [Propionivibrio dicarboxylicus]|uniref:Uncharacterized protein n=1 Tax=Propionivibrio dicarboxylicus TaxID=83767 RepID=A0A1G8N6N8_9RHOO|nr:caspase family protein [Propionivibrio dicarboxylicus]SDI75959.1 protein of unknown function [Propionivibrio dicarboxylicus]